MFEKASRLKLRFEYRGISAVEDLWDLSVQALDAIYKALNAKVRLQKEESLLEAPTQADEILALKVAIVKHIVEVKLAEQKVREDATLKAKQKEKLLGILAEKQDEELRNMTPDQIKEMLNGMN
jgi:hypothetical protein